MSRRRREEEAYCHGPDCDRPAVKRGLCEGHRKQQERGRALIPLGEDPRGIRYANARERLLAAARRLGAAEDEGHQAYQTAAETLCKMAVMYATRRQQDVAELRKVQAQLRGPGGRFRRLSLAEVEAHRPDTVPLSGDTARRG